MGDLFESMVKGGAKVKDPDTMMAGAGGLLDRIDSLLMALALVLVPGRPGAGLTVGHTGPTPTRGPPMAVDPTGSDLKTFLAADDDGPVVMLNLLRFAPGGRELYAEYSRAVVSTFLPRVGGEVVYAGRGHAALVAEDGQAWDAVLLVRYPSRAAFARMVADPEYQQVTHLRTEALSEAVLQPTSAWG